MPILKRSGLRLAWVWPVALLLGFGLTLTLTKTSLAPGTPLSHTPNSSIAPQLSSSSSTNRVRYEAEDASSNINTETSFAGFSGKAYRCCWSENGQFVTFTVNVASPGSYYLTFGYSAGSGIASRNLQVNGQLYLANLPFPATSDWSTWGQYSLVVSLKDTTNKITLKIDNNAGNQNYLNLDYLDVEAASPDLPNVIGPVDQQATPTPMPVPAQNPGNDLNNTIANLTANTTNLVRYQKLELTFNLNGLNITNPYNPDEIKVDGYFTTPTGQTLIQPGFYYQDFTFTRNSANEENYSPQGLPQWKVRFTPKEVGTFQYYVAVTYQGKTVKSATNNFAVTDSTANPGFVRVSPDNPYYFAFENGQPFIGVGLNVAWRGTLRPIYSYEEFLVQKQQNKINFARVWLMNSLKKQYADWILSIQNQKPGENYDLQNAWSFDQILQSAESKGIYFDLTLDDVVQYSYNWDTKNLYNKANGGILDDPCDLFTDATARSYQKRLYRYLVARYGYSTSIHTWELFNEIDEMRFQCKNTNRWQPIFDQEYVKWHQDMADYIYSIDAHHHIVNTSTGSFKIHPELYRDTSQMNYAQIHYYYWPGWKFHPSDPACQDMAECTRYYSYLAYNSVIDKPSIVGEYGIGDTNGSNDKAGNFIHKALWAGIMSGGASTPLNFDFELHQQNPNWWQHYNAIASYLQNLDIHGLYPLKPVNINPKIADGYNMPDIPDTRADTISASNPNLRVMGLRNQAGTVYLWVDNKNDTWWNAQQGTRVNAQQGTVTIQGFSPGATYNVEVWDTYNGSINGQNQVTADKSGAITLQISNLNRDVAYKIKASS